MILVPVKNVEYAKQRLSPVLDVAERSALAETMLEDVLQTLAAFQLKSGLGNQANRVPVALVTSNAHARRLAREFLFEIIEDPKNGGETEAVAMATRLCEARGVTSTLVIPGDIPLLEASELETILAAAPPGPTGGTVLVPAADGRGTNAVLRRPPASFPLRFGTDSFGPHLRAAQATGRPCVVLRLYGIALDVDTPADLASLLAAEPRTRTQKLLRAWGVPERLERLESGVRCQG